MCHTTPYLRVVILDPPVPYLTDPLKKLDAFPERAPEMGMLDLPAHYTSKLTEAFQLATYLFEQDWASYAGFQIKLSHLSFSGHTTYLCESKPVDHQ